MKYPNFLPLYFQGWLIRVLLDHTGIWFLKRDLTVWFGHETFRSISETECLRTIVVNQEQNITAQLDLVNDLGTHWSIAQCNHPDKEIFLKWLGQEIIPLLRSLQPVHSDRDSLVMSLWSKLESIEAERIKLFKELMATKNTGKTKV